MRDLTIDHLKRRAAWLLNTARTEMRWKANRGASAPAAIWKVTTLWVLDLIDECDYESFRNEHIHRITRRIERQAEGLPVLDR